MVVWSASRPRSRSSSSTSRNESEYRRYQRTAQRISSGSVCHHLKIAGRIACFMISSGYQPPLANVATQPLDVPELPGSQRGPVRPVLKLRGERSRGPGRLRADGSRAETSGLRAGVEPSVGLGACPGSAASARPVTACATIAGRPVLGGQDAIPGAQPGGVRRPAATPRSAAASCCRGTVRP